MTLARSPLPRTTCPVVLRFVPIVLVAALLGPARANAAPDLVAVAPELAKVEHEDARVRVVRLHIPAGASLPTHDRPRRVVVSLTPNHVRLTAPDGAERITRTEAGTFAWSEAAVRTVSNLGGPVENIVIELQRTTHAATPVSAPPSTPSVGYLSDPLHRWAFENQYVRVYEVRIPPGESSEFHRHAYDQVTVFVTGGRVSSQLEGQPWRPPVTIAPRGVAFAAHGAQPITHRVRNDGTTEYHVVLVQFLQ